MATYNIKRFADPDALKRMQQPYLLALLRPHQTYLASHGFDFPVAGEEIDHQTLAGILLTPDAAMPHDLGDTLYAINEMATLDAMDELINAASTAGLQLDASAEMTPSDVAVQVWLTAPALFERKHAERLVRRARSFQSFQSRESRGQDINTSPEALRSLEADLDDWFEGKKRGRGCRVFAFPKEDGIHFLVRHGQPFRREGSLDEKGSGSVYYRPEKHDTVVYIAASGELRLNAGSKGERDLYREKFGLHLFGDENQFPGTAKYTLEPLREVGADALLCGEVDGIEWIRLKEVHYLWGGAENEMEIRKAEDVFAALGRREAQIPHGPRIVKAGFLIKFTDSKSPRSVTIRPTNIADYTRDDDGGLAEQWLALRGFIISEREADEEAEPILVGA